LNAFLYYDTTQRNKDLVKDKNLAVNITIFMFSIIEILVFLSFYVLATKVIGAFYD